MGSEDVKVDYLKNLQSLLFKFFEKIAAFPWL